MADLHPVTGVLSSIGPNPLAVAVSGPIAAARAAAAKATALQPQAARVQTVTKTTQSLVAGPIAAVQAAAATIQAAAPAIVKAQIAQVGQSISGPTVGNGPTTARTYTPIYASGSPIAGSAAPIVADAGGSTTNPIATPLGGNVAPADSGSTSSSISPLLILGAGALAVLFLKKGKLK